MKTMYSLSTLPLPILLGLLLFIPLQTLGADVADVWKQTLFPIDRQGKWGYIDRTGRIVIAPLYEEVAYFSEGLAAVKLHGKYGYIDTQGNIAISPRFKYAFAFHENLAWINDEPSGFIDRMGKIVVSVPGAGYCREFRDGLAKVMPSETDRNAAVAPKPKIGFIDKTGKYAIPPQFDDASDFVEGLAAVEQDGRWGFIDKTGALVITPRYEHATGFSEGVAAVVHNGRTGYIDRNGQPLFAADYEDGVGYSEGLAAVKIGGKWGWIDRAGHVVIAAQFEEASSFANGRASILWHKRYGYIDHAGKRIVEATYLYAHFFLGDLAGVTFHPERGDGLGTGYVDQSGKVIWKPEPVSMPGSGNKQGSQQFIGACYED